MSKTKDSSNGAKAPISKKLIQLVKDATGAPEDDIQTMLTLCDGDVNEAVNRLLDNPFQQVLTKEQKKKKKEQDEQKKTVLKETSPVLTSSRGPAPMGRSGGYGGRPAVVTASSAAIKAKGRGPGPIVPSTTGVPKPLVDAVDELNLESRAAVGPRTGGTMADLLRAPAPTHAPVALSAPVESSPDVNSHHVAESLVADLTGSAAPAPKVEDAWGKKPVVVAVTQPAAPVQPVPAAAAPAAPQAPVAATVVEQDKSGLAYQFGQFSLGAGSAAFGQDFGQGFGQVSAAAPQPTQDASAAAAQAVQTPYANYDYSNMTSAFYGLGGDKGAAAAGGNPAAPQAPQAPSLGAEASQPAAAHAAAQQQQSAPQSAQQQQQQQQMAGFPQAMFPQAMQPGMYGYGGMYYPYYPQAFQAYPSFQAPGAAPYPSASSAFPGAPNRAGIAAGGYGSAFAGGYGAAGYGGTAEDASAAYKQDASAQAAAAAANPYAAYNAHTAQASAGRTDQAAAANPYAQYGNYGAYAQYGYGMQPQVPQQQGGGYKGLGN